MPDEHNSLVRDRHSILPQPGNSSPQIWIENQDESLNEVFRVLRKRKSIILTCVLVCLALAVVACIVMTPKYDAVATVELNKGSSFDSGGLGSVASALTGDDDLKTQLQTEIAVMQGPSIALAVIEELKLRSDEDFRISPGLSGLFGAKKKILERESGLPLEQAPLTRELLLKRFSKRLKIDAQPSTRLITVTYTSRDAVQAATIANMIIEEHKRQDLSSHYASVQETSQWLTEQLAGLKSKCEASEKLLADFEHQTGIIGLGQPSISSSGVSPGLGGGENTSSNPVLQKLLMLNTQLTTAELNRITKEAIYKLVQTEDPAIVANLGNSPLVSDGNSSVTLQGGGLTILTNLLLQQNSLKLQHSQAAATLGTKNPRLVDLETEMSELDAQVRDELTKITRRARDDYELSKNLEDGVHRQLEAQQLRANTVNDQLMKFGILQQEAVSNQLLYDSLYNKLQEANIEAGVKASNITVINPARAPALPVVPNCPMLLMGGLGAGLLFGFCGAFTAESLDRSVVAIEQAEAITSNSVLGIIPDFTPPSSHRNGYARNVKAWNKQLPVPASAPCLIAAPDSVVSEAFRSLRTAILLSRADAPKVLSITSAVQGEGKTTVILNLAVSFAQQGSRVLLIEADMRRPKLIKGLDCQDTKPAIGLSNLLTGTADLKDAVFEYPDAPDLSVIYAGQRPPNPAELLGSARFPKLLERASEEFDVILIDTPPAMLVTDGVLIAAHVDGALCVIRANVTTRPTLQRLSELLRKNNCPVLGFVMNAVNTKSADYKHHYGLSGNNDYYDEGRSDDRV